MRGSFVVACLLAACVPAQQPPPSPPRHTDLGLSISSGTLRNGLRVVVVEDPRASQIQVTMRYQVGAVDDPVGREGMAHLVEHLMYQQVLGAESLFSHLEHHATEFNGETSLDSTTYWERAQPDRLDEMLSIEGVRVGMRCAGITDSIFTREREVVIDELHLRSTLSKSVLAELYPAGHPYHRTAIDSEDTLRSITREEACAFAEAHYATTNAVLVVSGAVDRQRVETALGKFIARVAQRTVTAPTPVPQLGGPHHGHLAVPFDADAVILAWPLPSDPELRAQMRAVAPAMRDALDSQIAGNVIYVELGGDRAPLLCLLAEPGPHETIDDIIRIAADEHTPWPGKTEFQKLQQQAIYELYASLEDGSRRDQQLAQDMAAGRDPATSLAKAAQGLREITAEQAHSVMFDKLSFEEATIVRLEHAEGKAGGKTKAADQLVQAIHDMGQRRDLPDPAEAKQPASESVTTRGLSGLRTRTLPNGMHVALLSTTSVPTVDARIVFASGSADDPAASRGAAFVAAHLLTFDLHHLADLVLFYRAGARLHSDVERDRTAFVARGLDMHLDLMLAGLRRLVLDGIYDSTSEAALSELDATSKKVDDEGAFTDAWRAAIYGEHHPYAFAGLLRHASKSLSLDDARRFRAHHLQPDNATLVIAGRFDLDLADRWIDYLFADWSGHAERRPAAVPATIQPVALAKVDDSKLVGVHIVLPATAGTRATQLVAAQLLDGVVRDVRHQLGASYAFDATLVESRLATHYSVTGIVEAPRAAEAMQLVMQRVAQLRTDPAAAASAFVLARGRVLVQLASVNGSASRLADRIEEDIALGREPLSDAATALAVKQLTIDDMAETLAELDLARAAIQLRGPEDALDRTFAALGRTPKLVEARPDDETAKRARFDARAARRRAGELEMPTYLDNALTDAGAASRYTVAFAAGYAWGTQNDLAPEGIALSADLGIHTEITNWVGLHASLEAMSGTVHDPTVTHSYSVVPVDLAFAVHASAYDRLWGGVFLGLRATRVHDELQPTSWGAGMCVGLQGGVDLFDVREHRIAAYGRAEGVLLDDNGFSSFVLGVAYRR